MKKFLSMVFCLCFLLAHASGEHLGIDFDALSTEDLQYIYNEVSARLQKKESQIKEAVVPSGTYVVGQDLPAGSYLVKSNDAMPNGMGAVENIETGEASEVIYFVYGMENETIVHLHDGEQLTLLSVAENSDNSTFTITPYTGLLN